VDTNLLQDYTNVVKTPMDLGTMKSKMEGKEFSFSPQWLKISLLILIHFNGKVLIFYFMNYEILRLIKPQKVIIVSMD